VSGISGVEWDAVELPSQFMENFCWEWSVLRHMTAHVDTGEPLPRELFDKMLAAKNFQSGLQTLRQIEFSLVDMRLHTEGDKAQDFMQVLRDVRAEVAVLQSPAWGRTLHTFNHIFAGGYAAGYYSYKWAEVLSADAYAAFEETAAPDGTPSIDTGRRYRETILEVGGSRPAMESFKAFRGREPQLDALLRHQGMTAANLKIQSLDAACGSQQADLRLLIGKHAHGHHAWPLTDSGFKRHRVGDFQACHIHNVLTVVSHQRLALFHAHFANTPHRFKLANNLGTGHWNDFDRQRKSPERVDQLAFIRNAHKLFRLSCHNFFACQRSTTAFDHVAVVIDFVGAIDVHRQTLYFSGVKHMNAQRLQTLGRGH
jgi:hypothetical protein